MSLDREKAFNGLKEHIKNVLEQMEKTNPSSECNPKDYDAFLTGLENSGSVLAQSINNTALAYRTEPSPTESESEGLCKNIELRIVEFLNSFLAVPLHCGKYFFSEVRAVCMSTMKSCISFVEALIQLNQMVRKKKRKKLILQESVLSTVAEVWEKGHDSTKGLPQNNYDACSKFILNQLCMINDAISELDDARALIASEEVKSDIDEYEIDEFDLRWSEADLILLGPATGLLKTIKNLAKKIGQTAKKIGNEHHAMDDMDEKNVNLDRLCDICARLSPASDDLAATLYPPIEHMEVKAAATSLITISKELLDEKLLMSVLQMPINDKSRKTITLEEGTKDQGKEDRHESFINWAEFLAKALNHNEEQLNLRLAERGISTLIVDERTN